MFTVCVLCIGDPRSIEGSSVLSIWWEVEVWWRGRAWVSTCHTKGATYYTFIYINILKVHTDAGSPWEYMYTLLHLVTHALTKCNTT